MRLLTTMAVLLSALLAAGPALAYIGPGAGLGAIGAVLGLLLGVVVAIGVVLMWPIRVVLRHLKRRSAVNDGSGDGGATAPDS